MPGGAQVIALRLASPAGASPQFAGWGGNTEMVEGVRRWWDPANRVYGGYELRVQGLGNGQFNVIVRGLGMAMDGYHRVELPGIPWARVVRRGEEFEVDLARRENARLFDRVRVLR